MSQDKAKWTINDTQKPFLSQSVSRDKIRIIKLNKWNRSASKENSFKTWGNNLVFLLYHFIQRIERNISLVVMATRQTYVFKMVTPIECELWWFECITLFFSPQIVSCELIWYRYSTIQIGLCGRALMYFVSGVKFNTVENVDFVLATGFKEDSLFYLEARRNLRRYIN